MTPGQSLPCCVCMPAEPERLLAARSHAPSPDPTAFNSHTRTRKHTASHAQRDCSLPSARSGARSVLNSPEVALPSCVCSARAVPAYTAAHVLYCQVVVCSSDTCMQVHELIGELLEKHSQRNYDAHNYHFCACLFGTDCNLYLQRGVVFPVSPNSEPHGFFPCASGHQQRQQQGSAHLSSS